jgi:hypothetical protein
MVSRVHCAFVNSPFGLWVVDLLGREGTYVNGVTVRWGLLEPDDEMQIDQFRIRVRYLTPPTHAAVPFHPLETADEDLTPSANAKGTSESRSLALAGNAWEMEEAQAKSSSQIVAPVGLGVPMTGSESLLMPLVKQFSLMQQQMFDQFHQTVLMMAQMFGNVQRDQMTLIRQELEQIQELTRQLHALPLEGARQPIAPLPMPPQAPAADVPSAPSPSAKSKPAAAKSAPSPPPRKFPEGDVHAWLSQRLAALQEERQTRWQKVLSLLTGK